MENIYQRAQSMCHDPSQKDWMHLRFERGMTIKTAAMQMGITEEAGIELEANTMRNLRRGGQ